MIRFLNTLIICFSISLSVVAQQDSQTSSVDLTGASFDQLVKIIEEQTPYHFYFRRADTDSIRVTVKLMNTPVFQILDQVFSGTDLHYSLYENQIYVAKGRRIVTKLPTDFFNEEKKTTPDAVMFDFRVFERSEKQVKTAEEKLYVVGTKSADLQGEVTLSGVVKDMRTGEGLAGASVFIENPTIGVATDPFGRYSLRLPKGRHILKIHSVGMKNTQRQVMLYSMGNLNVELEDDITPLKEVVVQAEADVRVTGMQMGMEKVDVKTMRQMPLALGEPDIMKVMMTLPGVQTTGEGTVGLNVRGGATSQNLILFNDAVVYNPSHLFGFFSTFNSDVIKSAELYKSGIGAEYGGRLSSVLEVHGREGNLKKFSGSGGISPIAGRLTLEGPLVKERTSFLIGVRSTYSDWLLHQLKSKTLQHSAAAFYDLTANLTHKINDNNSISLTGYLSQDEFRLGSDTAYRYSDRNTSVKWKHVFNKKLYSTVTGSQSMYNYSVSSSYNPVTAFKLDFSIKQLNAKADFIFFPTAGHTLTAGASIIRYTLAPGNFQPKGTESLSIPDVLQQEQAVESAIYAGENFEINPKLSVYFGMRYSLYAYLGPRDVYQYTTGQPRQENTLEDTTRYDTGKRIADYSGFEPRASLRLVLSKNSSLKMSYNRMRQYIQMLSNTAAITPIDIWKLSDSYVKPQVGDQISFGYYKNLKGNVIEASVETYYKIIQNTVDYKNGAVLLLNHHLETDVLNGNGKAYGIEFMLRKPAGRLNGWLSYTYSRTFLQTTGAYSSEIINQGKFYPASYDKPHAINFIGNYKINRRFNFSLSMVYSTGRPITLPIVKYDLEGAGRVYYSDRNQYRIPDYFRTDLSFNIEGNHKIKKLKHSSWTIAVYNLMGRHNAYSVYFVSRNGVINGYKLSIFGQAIPTITYNFKF